MKPLPVVQPQNTPAPAAASSPPQTDSMTRDPERTSALEPQIVAVLRKVFDPEIPVSIYELGLIYDIIVDSASAVGIRMTLTAPACPAAQSLPGEVKRRIAEIPGVAEVKVDVVWDPPWDKDRMSDAAKLQLGMW
jgi:FeS assembly SUF system protein